MNNETKLAPVFIISLPRSGSTLLQKMLAAHKDINSVAEPWLLLPLSTMKNNPKVKSYSNFSMWHTQIAIDDFIQHLPEKDESFNKIIRDFIINLYSDLDSNALFFVDKTPRYHLIIDFIVSIFPEAKFIFLCRHPLDILASIITSWGKDKLHITHWAMDLYQGPFNLFEGYQNNADQSIVINYNELVTHPKQTLIHVCDFLGIKYSDTLLSGWSTLKLQGSMGDTKIKAMKSIDTKSIDVWKTVLNTHVRKIFAKWYIKYLSSDVLNFMNVDLDLAQKELRRLKCSWKKTFPDLWSLLSATIGRFIAIKVLREQWKDGLWKSDLLS